MDDSTPVLVYRPLRGDYVPAWLWRGRVFHRDVYSWIEYNHPPYHAVDWKWIDERSVPIDVRDAERALRPY